MSRGARGALAGAIAGVLAVTLMLRGTLTAGFPVFAWALWDRPLRLMPMEVFGFLIVRLKFLAKPLAFWGMLGTVIAVWALLGYLIGREPWIRRPAGTSGVAAAGILATFLLAFAVTFVPLVGLAFTSGVEYLRGRLEGMGVLEPSRVAASGVLAGSARGRWLAGAGRQTVAYAQDFFSRIRGLPPEVTPTHQFYVVSKNPPGFDPVLEEATWQLEVRMQPDKPLVLGLAQLKAMPSVRRPHTLECISNEIGGELISNAYWRGVRLRDVLARAGGVPPKAIKIVFRCADGYTESLPIAEAMHPDTLLVYEINGDPLPPKHGFPLRLLVPGLFGMKNPKWITRIEAADFDFQGYWERSGWSDQAVVQTMSKFTAPPRTPRPKANEEVGLGGVAYVGARGIKAVDVSLDDGKTWQPAQIKPPLGPYTWVLWAALWKPTAPGEYRLKVRARDGTGVVQTAQPSPTLPDGATGYHTIRVRVG